MKINVSEDAIKIIKAAIKDSAQLPRVVFKNGGCAGGMFVLTLSSPEKGDNIIKTSDIDFAISEQVMKFSNDISIVTKSLLDAEVTVINNSAKNTCRCKKSFRVDNK